jgi:transcriptional antiterminator RfaH
MAPCANGLAVQGSSPLKEMLTMPILAAETTVFPDNLLENWMELNGGRQWWVVHTKARQEKSLSRELLSQETPFYLPLIRKSNLIRGRKVNSHIPLFPGYLFVLGTDDDRRRVMETNRACQALCVGEADRLVRDLRDVQRLIDANAPLTVEARLAPGRRVRIHSGSLAGLEGEIIRRRDELRLLVRVNFLQKGVSMEIDDFLLEPID